MEILGHTDQHQPTLMRDIFENLVGETVFVRAPGVEVEGVLKAYNGYILHLSFEYEDGVVYNHYIRAQDVISISADK